MHKCDKDKKDAAKKEAKEVGKHLGMALKSAAKAINKAYRQKDNKRWWLTPLVAQLQTLEEHV